MCEVGVFTIFKGCIRLKEPNKSYLTVLGPLNNLLRILGPLKNREDPTGLKWLKVGHAACSVDTGPKLGPASSSGRLADGLYRRGLMACCMGKKQRGSRAAVAQRNRKAASARQPQQQAGTGRARRAKEGRAGRRGMPEATSA
jgi:hypothetical protein